jgi:hypothetical protein
VKRVGLTVLVVVLGAGAGVAIAGGEQKTNYVSAVERVENSTQAGTKSPRELAVPCPEGKFVLGGGASVDGPKKVVLKSSWPYGKSGWQAVAVALKPTATDCTLTVWAICADTGSPGPFDQVTFRGPTGPTD